MDPQGNNSPPMIVDEWDVSPWRTWTDADDQEFHQRLCWLPFVPTVMPPQLRLNAVAFVSPQNHPILIRTFVQGQDELKYHYIAHTSLDVIDERSASVYTRVPESLGRLTLACHLFLGRLPCQSPPRWRPSRRIAT